MRESDYRSELRAANQAHAAALSAVSEQLDEARVETASAKVSFGRVAPRFARAAVETERRCLTPTGPDG